MGMPGRKMFLEYYRFSYNGQERLTDLSLANDHTTALFWEYDTKLAKRWNLDPKLKTWESGYCVLGGNPVSNLDPLGDEWFKDKSGTRQFSPEINSRTKLGEGEVYIGATDIEETKRGIVNYRNDGSILYSNQTDAYNRIWYNSKANSNGKEKEQFGIIMAKSVLVTPDYKNESTESSPVQYGYKFEGGKILDPVSNSYLTVIGTIHSHPLNMGQGSQKPSVWGPYGSDVITHTHNFPNKPFLTMGWDKAIYGAIGNQNGWSWIEFPVEVKTVDQLLKGYDLRSLLINNQVK